MHGITRPPFRDKLAEVQALILVQEDDFLLHESTGLLSPIRSRNLYRLFLLDDFLLDGHQFRKAVEEKQHHESEDGVLFTLQR
jgi:hypothetical protein